MTFSKFISLMLLVSAVAACSVESRKKNAFDQQRGKDFQAEKGTSFRVDGFSVVKDKVTVAERAGNGSPRRKIFTFLACLKDHGGTGVPGGLAFSINGGGDQQVKTTDNAGCLTWSENLDFVYVGEPTFVRLQRRIAALTRFRGFVDVDLPFNPWTDVVWDKRNAEIPHPVLDAGPVNSKMRLKTEAVGRINLDTVSFDFRGLNYDKYEITPYLQLKVAHNYQISMKPLFVRKVLADVKSESFTGGAIRVTLAIFRERMNSEMQFTAENLIFSDTFVVRDETSVGTYFSDVVLKFDDVAALTSRTAALVTLEFDESEGLPEMNLSGVLKPGRLSTLSRLVPSKHSAKSIAEASAQLRAEAVASKPFDFFISQAKGFRAVDADPVRVGSLFGSRDVRVDQLLADYLTRKDATLDKRELRALCFKLFPDEKRQKACENDPAEYLAAGRREFVEDVHSVSYRAGSTTVETLKSTLSLSVSKSKTTTISKSLTAGAGLSAGLGIGWGKDWVKEPPKQTPTDPLQPKPARVPGQWYPNPGKLSPISLSLGLKLNAGANIGWTREWRDTDGETVSLGVSSETSVTSEGATFDLDLTSKRCAIVTAHASALTKEEKDQNVSLGLYLCADKAERKNVSEVYYLLGQSNGAKDSLFSDSDSNASTSWRTLSRGRRNTMALYDLLQNSKAKLVLEQAPEGAVLKEFQALQEYPGVLSVD